MKAEVTFMVTKTITTKSKGFKGLDEAQAVVKKELKEKLKGYAIDFSGADEC